MHPRPKAIFFDLDETLISNHRDIKAMFADLVDTHLPDSKEKLPNFMQAMFDAASNAWQEMLQPQTDGKSVLLASFRRAIDCVDGNTDLANAMLEHFITTAASGSSVNDNAIDLLKELRSRDIQTGIITNGFCELQQAKIDYHGLGDWVDAVVISEQAGAHKPDRRVFDYALRQLGVEAACAWHVGDHLENDVGGASQAGMTAVHYSPGGQAGGQLCIGDLWVVLELFS